MPQFRNMALKRMIWYNYNYTLHIISYLCILKLSNDKLWCGYPDYLRIRHIVLEMYMNEKTSWLKLINWRKAYRITLVRHCPRNQAFIICIQICSSLWLIYRIYSPPSKYHKMIIVLLSDDNLAMYARSSKFIKKCMPLALVYQYYSCISQLCQHMMHHYKMIAVYFPGFDWFVPGFDIFIFCIIS